MPIPSQEQLHLLRERAYETCRIWPLDEVQFSVGTGWTQNYSDLFAGRFTCVLEEKQILDSVLAQGRAILSSRGGDGKTWLLRRLYKQILDREDVPVLLDLKQWTGNDYLEWKKWTSSEIGNAGDFLVRRFGGLDLGTVELDHFSPDVSKVLLVDGLNEITSSVGAQILQLIDELVRDQINLSALVADRLIRRELPNPTRWSIGTLRPLSEDQVRKHLGDKVDVEQGGILTSPFFLDAALRYHVEVHHKSQASEQFLTLHGGVSEADLDQVAAAAFDAYQRSRSRIFDRAMFAGIAGEAATTALEHSKMLVPAANDRRYFLHHILHDNLAARHFATLPVKDWTPQALSELTFDSSSFDAVALVFERLSGEIADLFLRQLYDWNLYAAGYALAQARDTDASVSTEMRSMIFAMLAEKRFDNILATRQKAGDALALMQLSDVQQYREAQSLEEIFVALDAINSSHQWFNEWKRLFQTSIDSELSAEVLTSIRKPDSVTGWTVANVAKRSVIDEEAQSLLREWLQGEISSTVRWRIAHVLGVYPTKTTFEALLRLLDEDPNESVRYGAIRSIVELAAQADGELRDTIFGKIEERSRTITMQPKILGELRTCLLLNPEVAKPGWVSFVEKIVRALFIAVDDLAERNLWRQCLSKAESLYAKYEEDKPASRSAGVKNDD